ncbi:MAG: hypothetical protein HY770_01445, partial [Chitinivibrionia bacterium]|nr:hypothetical protein [Chitinivibrionia bacterium]
MIATETVAEKKTNIGTTLLRVEKLKKYYPIRSGFFSRVVGNLKAVDGV